MIREKERERDHGMSDWWWQIYACAHPVSSSSFALSLSLVLLISHSFLTHFTALLYPKHGKYVVVCVLIMVGVLLHEFFSALLVSSTSSSSSFIFKYSNARKREDKGVHTVGNGSYSKVRISFRLRSQSLLVCIRSFVRAFIHFIIPHLLFDFALFLSRSLSIYNSVSIQITRNHLAASLALITIVCDFVRSRVRMTIYGKGFWNFRITANAEWSVHWKCSSMTITLRWRL